MKSDDLKGKIGNRAVISVDALSPDQHSAMICVSEFFDRNRNALFCNAWSNFESLYCLAKQYSDIPLIKDSLRRFTEGVISLNEAISDLPKSQENGPVLIVREFQDSFEDLPFREAIGSLVGFRAWLNHHPEFCAIAKAVDDIIGGYAGIEAVNLLATEF